MPNQSFPVVTHGVWRPGQETSTLNLIGAKAAGMALEGKTDNLPEYTRTTDATNVRRNWLDVSAANEWISFINGVGGTLVSISVER